MAKRLFHVKVKYEPENINVILILINLDNR